MAYNITIIKNEILSDIVDGFETWLDGFGDKKTNKFFNDNSEMLCGWMQDILREHGIITTDIKMKSGMDEILCMHTIEKRLDKKRKEKK